MTSHTRRSSTNGGVAARGGPLAASDTAYMRPLLSQPTQPGVGVYATLLLIKSPARPPSMCGGGSVCRMRPCTPHILLLILHHIDAQGSSLQSRSAHLLF